MKIATRLGIFLVFASLAAGTLSLTGVAFADKPENPNLWGKEASQLARDPGDEDEEVGSEMGEHSREGGSAGEAPFDSDGEAEGDKPGRIGVGNIDEALPGAQEDHPSGVVDFLCNGGTTCPEPNPAD